MKTTGILNPFFILLIAFPIYLSIDMLIASAMAYQNKEISVSLILPLILGIFSLFLLILIKVIIIRSDNILVIYPFRFSAKQYEIKELVSVFSQDVSGESTFSFKINKTYLFYCKERRIIFSSVEFLNYKKLRDRAEQLEKATAANKAQ